MRLNIEKAVELYYSTTEIRVKDIAEMFSASVGTAQKLRRIAKEQMLEEDKKCMESRAVLTDVAFRAWGLDIAELEKKLDKMYRLIQKQAKVSTSA